MLKLANLLARWLAYAGGVVLCLLCVVVVASVSGRALIGLGLKPVPGDFELVEMGTAMAVFFFLPWCYLRAGHAMVDLLYLHLPAWARKAVNVLSDLLMLGAWLILTWRLGIAVADKYSEHETTFILQMPLWIGHAIGFAGAAVGCFVYLAGTLAEMGLISKAAGEPQPATPAAGHA
jgi:TRAP-type C4-dicarboxylate transport system permease small subunit